MESIDPIVLVGCIATVSVIAGISIAATAGRRAKKAEEERISLGEEAVKEATLTLAKIASEDVDVQKKEVEKRFHLGLLLDVYVVGMEVAQLKAYDEVVRRGKRHPLVVTKYFRTKYQTKVWKADLILEIRPTDREEESVMYLEESEDVGMRLSMALAHQTNMMWSARPVRAGASYFNHMNRDPAHIIITTSNFDALKYQISDAIYHVVSELGESHEI